MSRKSEEKAKKEAEEKAKAEAAAKAQAGSGNGEDLAPKLSTYIAYAAKKLEAIEPGHREIDIAAKDAIAKIEEAVSLVKFIEEIQGK